MPSDAVAPRVRPRVDADLTDLIGVLADTHVVDGYPIGGAHVSADWLRPAGLRASWVAVVDGHAVGHAAIKDVGHTEAVELTRMFVAPGSRGVGLAAELLDAVDAHVADHGLTIVLVVAEKDTAAIGLYEKRGWRETGRGTEQWLGLAGPVIPVRHYTATASTAT